MTQYSMKEYNLLKEEDKKANPTVETQERVLETIKNSEKPLTITSISQISKVGFNEVKCSIAFLKSLGVLETIVSGGNVTMVFLKKGDVQNATN